MMKYQAVGFGAVAAISLCVGLGCGGDGGVPGAAFTLRTGSYPATAGDPVHEGPFTQTSPTNQNVDILFMLDTSLSLTRDERSQISTNLLPLIGEMSDVSQVSIAFALAWARTGDHTNPAWPGDLTAPGYDGSGNLYNVHGRLASNYVATGHPVTDAGALKTAIEDVFNVTPPIDSRAAGGEMGTYSFNQLVTQPSLTAAAKGYGFLSATSATPLMVVFIADENDICLDPRPFSERLPSIGDLPDVDSEFNAYQNYCIDSTKKLKYTLKSMYEAAKAVTGPAPVQFSGIIYPRGYLGQAGTGKETGYGYLEAIEMTGGVVVDLNSDFSAGLKNLGNAINAMAANIQRAFVLNPPSGTFVNPNSIRVTVEGAPVTFRFDQTTNTVTLDYAGHTGDHVVIDYRVIHAN